MPGRLSPEAIAQSRRYLQRFPSVMRQQESLSEYLALSMADTLRRVFVTQFEFSQTHARDKRIVREQLFFEF